MRQQKAAVRETLTRSLRWQACMPSLTCVVVVRLCATSREVLGRFRWQISTLLCVVVADGENHCVSLTAACLLLTQGKAFGVVGSDGVIGMYDPRNLREVRTVWPRDVARTRSIHSQLTWCRRARLRALW